MNMIGLYSFRICFSNMFMNSEYIITNKNLITNAGELYFLNRWINNDITPINRIMLGKGNNKPNKNDTDLTNKKVTKIPTIDTDLTNKKIVITADFTYNEAVDTCEIGVCSDNLLLSHDVYEKIDIPNTSTVTMNYEFILETSAKRTSFTKKSDTNYTYFIEEQNNVYGVYEEDTNSGYTQQNSIIDVENNTASYYYDYTKKLLYIHPNKDTITVDNKMKTIYLKLK